MKRLITLCLLLASPVQAADYFVNANVGVFKSNGFFYDGFQFDFGGKVGVKATRIGDFSHLALALAVNHTSANAALATKNTEVMVQPLFTEVSGSHLYFAPQLGISIVGLASDSTALFTYGVLAGYAIPLAERWAIAPEANLTRYSYLGDAQTALKFLVGATYAL